MKLADVIERVELAVSTAGSPDAGLPELKAALGATSQVQSFLAACRAELLTAIGRCETALPEAAVAETSRCSLGAATKETGRAATLERAPAMADALADGAITPGHADALTRQLRGMDDEAKASLLDDDAELADEASRLSIAAFNALLKRKRKALERNDGEDRLERQRRATRLASWTDDDGMWNVKGRFDPVLGAEIARRLGIAVRTTFAETLPATAPADPIERAQHLEALALADLICGPTLGTRAPTPAGGPALVVVDATQTDGAGGPVVDWGIPVEIPHSVLTQIFGVHDPDVVIVANGVVLHAPGRLDLGRTTRLANRAQRRALRGLYATCAVPGCAVHYDRCKLHHIIWWRHGGRTDLANLLPVCQRHHTLIHTEGWDITLGPQRQLTVRLSSGQTMTTGPPHRGAA